MAPGPSGKGEPPPPAELVDTESGDAGTTLPPGATRFVVNLPGVQRVNGLAANRAGEIAVSDRSSLSKFRPDGTLLWRQPVPTPLILGGALSFSPLTDAVFAAIAIKDSENSAMPSLYRVKPDGSAFELIEKGQDPERAYGPVAFNPSGLRLVGSWSHGSFDLDAYRADDSRAWFFHQGDEGKFTLDAQGNALIVLRVWDVYPGDRIPLTAGTHLLKLSPEGNLLWKRTLNSNANLFGSYAYVESLGTTNKGTVVLSGTYQGEQNWDGTKLAAPPSGAATFLWVVEADGTTRWVKSLRQVDNFSSNSGSGQIAVDPAGAVTILQRPARTVCDGYLVTHFNLAGEQLWERRFQVAPCDADVHLSIALSGQSPVLAGEFAGTVDFGFGPIGVPHGQRQQAVLVGLAP